MCVCVCVYGTLNTKCRCVFHSGFLAHFLTLIFQYICDTKHANVQVVFIYRRYAVQWYMCGTN